MKSSRIAMAAASGLVALSFTAAPAFAAPGNNGTLKVHEFGTPSGTESNDPHVCKFNFEAFNLDATKQGGVVTITPPVADQVRHADSRQHAYRRRQGLLPDRLRHHPGRALQG